MNEEQVTALKVWIMRLLARIIFVKCIKEHGGRQCNGDHDGNDGDDGDDGYDGNGGNGSICGMYQRRE